MTVSAPCSRRCALAFPPVALAAALALLAPGCGEKEPLQVGFVGGLSGRTADLGISGRNGAMLAVETRNATGGVKGRKVRLVVRDDGQDTATALVVDRELVDLGVEAVIGHMTSSMSMAAVPLMNESSTVMVSPTTTTNFLSARDDNFIRVTASTKVYASKMARYLRSRGGVEIVAVVYELGNRAYTESWYQDFREEFTSLGGLIAGVDTFRSGPDTHFHEIADRLLAPGVEGVVIIAGSLDTAMFCQQIRKIGRQVLVAGPEWAATEELVELGGAAVEGIVVSQFFDRQSTAPAYKAFEESYRRRFGEEPGFAAVAAWDAAVVVLDGLERKRRGETLKEAILRISTFSGLQEPVVIDRFGDAGRRTYITTVREGRFQVIE